MNRFASCLGVVISGLGVLVGQDPAAGPSAVRIVEGDGALRVELDGELFTEYRHGGLRQPILYPVLGPGGVAMTRNYPMAEAEGEARDHPHHVSLWYAHGDVNGRDFWTGADGSRIVQGELVSAEGNEIRTVNLWVDGDGELVCTDERVLRFGGSQAARWIDYGVTIHASAGELKLGDTKEGTLGIRMNPSLRLRGEVAEGSAVNSEGVRGIEVWGKRARWIDYSGPVAGKVVGIAMFDHPENPRYPTWWHAREYGLNAANPFGVHDFEEGREPGTGDLVVADGTSITFRYRFYFHLGDAEEAGVSRAFEAFIASEG